MTLRPQRSLCAATLAFMLAPGLAVAQTAPTQGSDAGTPSSRNTPEAAVSRAPATPIASDYPPDAIGDGPTTGGYNQSRWVEDWRGKRDPAKRDDPLDRLKYLPIDADGDVYLTLSGELRLRTNHTTNPNLRDARAQRQDTNRIVGGVDLHVGPHFRGYFEIAHGGLSGVELGNVVGTLRNRLVVQQSFVDATTDVGDVNIGARYGRQEFTDGSNLMISARDNNTIRVSNNGLRAWARTRSVRVDLFDFKLTQYGVLGTGDDRIDDNRRFSGVTTGVVVPRDWFGGSKLYVDPFVWRLRTSNAVWGSTTAREARNYYGVHAWGDAGPVTLDWTVNHQGGDYNGRTIDAWQVLMAQTYRIGKTAAAPRIGIRGDYASGGGAYGTGKLRNAFSPYGNNIYYSYQLFATPTNLVAIAPSVTVAPVKKVRATLEYQFSWRDDVRDAVYRANNAAFAGTQIGDARKIAETTRLQVTWSVTPRINLVGRYEHLDAGPALTDAGYHNSDFLAGWISLRF